MAKFIARIYVRNPKTGELEKLFDRDIEAAGAFKAINQVRGDIMEYNHSRADGEPERLFGALIPAKDNERG